MAEPEIGCAAELWCAEQREVYGSNANEIDPQHRLTIFREIIAAPHTAWVGSAPAGQGLNSLLITRPGHLSHLYVTPGARSQGLGSRLVRHAQAIAPDGLTLHTTRRIAPFYERLGFIVADPGSSEDELCLRWNAAEHR